ncbi:hypothetical protein Baya_15890 [Bagarius yarrelli]|uniref:Uncharacterized protein n=1 Tax=Bagarius yarrelli TaxID=175774 RepID=A0A556VKR7_BAGYA|nr:hypothetical protein Baya_15890 [Bagarius yarrelli]
MNKAPNIYRSPKESACHPAADESTFRGSQEELCSWRWILGPPGMRGRGRAEGGQKGFDDRRDKRVKLCHSASPDTSVNTTLQLNNLMNHRSEALTNRDKAYLCPLQRHLPITHIWEIMHVKANYRNEAVEVEEKVVKVEVELRLVKEEEEEKALVVVMLRKVVMIEVVEKLEVRVLLMEVVEVEVGKKDVVVMAEELVKKLPKKAVPRPLGCSPPHELLH